jgi:membrane protease YdiL (CAAX protease family)
MPSPSQNFTRRVYHEGGEHPYRDDPPVAALEAVAIYTGAVACFILVGALVGPGLPTLAIAQVAGLAAPTIAWAVYRGDAIARLGLGAPPARAVIGALLVGATFWYVNERIAEPIVRALGDRELARLEGELTGPPLALQLAVVALLPALCEELLTRGVLARALRPALGRVLAVVVSAALFAALHMSLVRLAPTFLLGAVLAAITLAADSVWPAVLAHATNNAIAIVIASGSAPSAAAWIGAHPWIALSVASTTSLAGIVIALAPRRAA